MLTHKKLWADRRFLFMVAALLFAILFFVRNAGFELSHDDRVWLEGRLPTATDRFRIIPMAVFMLFRYTFGMTPIPIYVFGFLLHLVNALLVFRLSYQVTKCSTVSLVAFHVFLINPLTFQVLAWPSCLSYELGTTFALLAVIAGLHAGEVHGRIRTKWSALAFCCYSAGLLSSYDTLPVPLLIAIMSSRRSTAWLRRSAPILLLISAMGVAAIIGLYRFRSLNPARGRLLSLDFIADYVSSVIFFPACHVPAYLLSFFVKPFHFLPMWTVSESIRWLVTLVIIGAPIISYRPSQAWRLFTLLALSAMVVFSPHIIRVYSTPSNIRFDFSYLVWGRVLYLPFSVLAILMGHIGVQGIRSLRLGYRAYLAAGLWLTAICHALFFLYRKEDFASLVKYTPSNGPAPPPAEPWQPFATTHPSWLIALAVVVILGIAVRAHRHHNKHENMKAPPADESANI